MTRVLLEDVWLCLRNCTDAMNGSERNAKFADRHSDYRVAPSAWPASDDRSFRLAKNLAMEICAGSHCSAAPLRAFQFAKSRNQRAASSTGMLQARDETMTKERVGRWPKTSGEHLPIGPFSPRSDHCSPATVQAAVNYNRRAKWQPGPGRLMDNYHLLMNSVRRGCHIRMADGPRKWPVSSRNKRKGEGQ